MLDGIPTTHMARRAHRVVAWTLVAGVAAQMAMATFGLFVFLGARGYAVHGSFGRMLAILPLLVLATAVAGRLGRRDVAAAGGLVVLAVLQVGLVVLSREGVSIAMALHPANGGALLALAGYIAGRADPVVAPEADVAADGAATGVAPATA